MKVSGLYSPHAGPRPEAHKVGRGGNSRTGGEGAGRRGGTAEGADWHAQTHLAKVYFHLDRFLQASN